MVLNVLIKKKIRIFAAPAVIGLIDDPIDAPHSRCDIKSQDLKYSSRDVHLGIT